MATRSWEGVILIDWKDRLEAERIARLQPRREFYAFTCAIAALGHAARDDLGYVSRIGLEEGLHDLVQWWRSEQPASSVA